MRHDSLAHLRAIESHMVEERPRLAALRLNANRMSVRIAVRTQSGESMDLGVVQIAGLIARRIQCSLRKGQSVCRGDRFGIIRFGSRLELFLPSDARILVREGQSVKAGETAVAEFPF